MILYMVTISAFTRFFFLISKQSAGRPYDSTYGVSENWTYVLLAILFFLVLRVLWSWDQKKNNKK